MDPAALQAPVAGQELFKQTVGTAWGEVVSKGEVVGSVEVGSKLGLSNGELLQAWSVAKVIRLAPSMYVAKKKQGAEIVIALTHMRAPNDELLAHEVPEVDLILGGHDHHYEVKPVGPHGTYVLKS